MKCCSACNACFSSSQRNCTECGEAPLVLDGFDAYAPDLALNGSGFKASYFSELARLEESNFWFRARNKIIVWALSKYALNLGSFLEIGCGTGYVLSAIADNFPITKLSGSEIFIQGLRFAAKRLPSGDFMQMDARDIPFYEEYDAIGIFDVLEHIKEDDVVLAQAYKALKPGGTLLVTVPQHAWLWSGLDEYAFHERRYAARDLLKKINEAGFHIIRSTSFITALLPAMIISRIINNKIKINDPTAELKISPWLNSLFYKMITLELSIIRIEINFPVGGSRLVIANKI